MFDCFQHYALINSGTSASLKTARQLGLNCLAPVWANPTVQQPNPALKTSSSILMWKWGIHYGRNIFRAIYIHSILARWVRKAEVTSFHCTVLKHLFFILIQHSGISKALRNTQFNFQKGRCSLQKILRWAGPSRLEPSSPGQNRKPSLFCPQASSNISTNEANGSFHHCTPTDPRRITSLCALHYARASGATSSCIIKYYRVNGQTIKIRTSKNDFATDVSEWEKKRVFCQDLPDSGVASQKEQQEWNLGLRWKWKSAGRGVCIISF